MNLATPNVCPNRATAEDREEDQFHPRDQARTVMETRTRTADGEFQRSLE